MKKILITGASGLVGENFCHKYAKLYNIIGIYHNNNLLINGIKSLRLDISNIDELQKNIAKIKPEYILHLAALSDPNQCELNPDLSYKLNFETSAALAKICAQNAIKLVFASTDMVFDGKNAPYNETDTPSPLNLYGKHKLLAENAVLKYAPGSVICRLPLMYGLAYKTGRGLLEPMLNNLKNRIEIKLFTDEIRTPVSVDNVCEGLVIALENGNGNLHLGGEERVSRYEIGKSICNVFGYDENLLRPVLQKDIKMAALRPADVSLFSTKARALGFQPQTLINELKRLKTILQS